MCWYVPEDVGFAREIKIRYIKVAYCMFFLKIKIRYEMQRNIEISPPKRAILRFVTYR